jgi:succinate dehydrogenase / fumarate reductase membrane anchor subunit
MRNPASENNHENALLWFIKVCAGGLILFFLVIHFIINHLVAPGGLLTFKDVVDYYQNPGVLVMEGFFLTFILVHGLLGLRSVILDLNPSPRMVKLLDISLILLGFLVLVYGLWLLITVSSMGHLP